MKAPKSGMGLLVTSLCLGVFSALKFFAIGESQTSLANGGLAQKAPIGPPGANWAQKGPFGGILATSPRLRGAEASVPSTLKRPPDRPEKGSNQARKGPIFPKGFLPNFLWKFGASAPVCELSAPQRCNAERSDAQRKFFTTLPIPLFLQRHRCDALPCFSASPVVIFYIAHIALRPLLPFFLSPQWFTVQNNKKFAKSHNAAMSPLATRDGHRKRKRSDAVH